MAQGDMPRKGKRRVDTTGNPEQNHNPSAAAIGRWEADGGAKAAPPINSKGSSPQGNREGPETRSAKAEKAAQERRKVYAERDADARAVTANTARLRALRLARDAAELEAKAKAKSKPVKAKKKRTP
jgi:hypothetical protein